MVAAVISGDIISSTSLSGAGKDLLESSLSKLLKELHLHFNTFSRIIRGDYLECVVPIPADALRVALAIKSYVKTIPVEDLPTYETNRAVEKFKLYGIRLAIGYGELNRFDTEKGIIDGEAIYLSGRKINEYSTYGKERIVIKNTLYFVTADDALNNKFDSLIALLDFLVSKATSKQCEVLYLKLLGNSEKTISAKLSISQSVVNQHSTRVGWNAIEKAVDYFSKEIKEL